MAVPLYDLDGNIINQDEIDADAKVFIDYWDDELDQDDPPVEEPRFKKRSWLDRLLNRNQ